GRAEDRRTPPATCTNRQRQAMARLILLLRRELSAMLHAAAELNSDRRLWPNVEQAGSPPASTRSTLGRLIVALFGLLVVACGANPGAAPFPQHVDLRLGLYANLTHAPALVGIRQGIFARALGSDVTLATATFNAGPDAVTALLSNSIDAAYIGANPGGSGSHRAPARHDRLHAIARPGGQDRLRRDVRRRVPGGQGVHIGSL